MRDLRAHIEGIVHPIRATEGRKDRMREELLAHLTSAMAEEQSRGADEAGAAQRAVERLGDPVAVRRELQDSVPKWERVLFRPLPYHDRLNAWDHSFDQRSGESALRHAWRITFPIVLWNAAVVAFVVTMHFVAILRGREPRPLVPLLHFAGTLLGGMALLWFLCALCIHGFRKATAAPLASPRQRMVAALWCLAGAPLTVACGLLAYWTSPVDVDGMTRPLAPFLYLFLGSIVAMPVLIYVVGRFGAEQQRRYEEWQRLTER